MIIWTSKAALLAAAVLGLGACDGIQTAGFLGGLSVATSAPEESVALAQTQMANGAFTLVPPRGFCIDKNTLRQNFALMARCDVLGAPDRAGGAPVGIITVSVTALKDDASLPTPEQVADAAKLARISAEKSQSRAITFRAEGAPPAAGLDAKHWRGVAQIGDRLMGIALYGPKGARAVSSEGREVINDLIRQTHEGG